MESGGLQCGGRSSAAWGRRLGRALPARGSSSAAARGSPAVLVVAQQRKDPSSDPNYRRGSSNTYWRKRPEDRKSAKGSSVSDEKRRAPLTGWAGRLAGKQRRLAASRTLSGLLRWAGAGRVGQGGQLRAPRSLARLFICAGGGAGRRTCAAPTTRRCGTATATASWACSPSGEGEEWAGQAERGVGAGKQPGPSSLPPAPLQRSSMSSRHAGHPCCASGYEWRSQQTWSTAKTFHDSRPVAPLRCAGRPRRC